MARREAPTRAPEHPSQNLPISPTSRTPPVDPSRIRNPILEHPTNSQKASTWEREDGAGGFWAGFGGLVRLRFFPIPITSGADPVSLLFWTLWESERKIILGLGKRHPVKNQDLSRSPIRVFVLAPCTGRRETPCLFKPLSHPGRRETLWIMGRASPS